MELDIFEGMRQTPALSHNPTKPYRCTQSLRISQYLVIPWECFQSRVPWHLCHGKFEWCCSAMLLHTLSSFPLSLQTPKLKLQVKNQKLLREQKEWSLVSCRVLVISPVSPKQLPSLQLPQLSPVVVQLIISKRQCWWLLCQLTAAAKKYNTLSLWFPLHGIITQSLSSAWSWSLCRTWLHLKL